MRYTAIVLILAMLPGSLAAQSFEAGQGGYVLRRGKEVVRFDKGRWSAGLEGGPMVNWHMFLWHDKWVYETQDGGKIDAGPRLAEDGSITMAGAFSAREGSLPLKYSCRIKPTGEGVRVRYELEKTGELKLTNGVWLHVMAGRDQFQGNQRIWIHPTQHATLASCASGAADKFLLELREGRSLCFSTPGYHEVNTEGARGSYVFRVNLLRGDFPVGQKAAVEYTVGFADLPQTFPGDILPTRGPLKIDRVDASSAAVPQYGRLELTVGLGATYDNPFDPEDVALDAVFKAPSGKELAVPGFFMVCHRRLVSDGAEVMIPEDSGTWRVRFSPVEKGRYTWRLKLRDRSGETTGGEGTFEAVDAQSRGFVRKSKVDPHYLAFDDGQGYFPIGHNLPIYHTTGQLGDEAMRKFAAAKENFNRWWMSCSGFGIEWCDTLGWYRQDVSARVDMILDLAGELGLFYMMCMDTHQDFRENGWEMNPLNAKNGGPCRTPADWFTNETARKLYKKRLRYTVARWGYSPHVLCWEFGNEFEGWDKSPNAIKLPWHKEMSDHLRRIDPFGHLITTSFWGHTGPEEFWRLENIDIVQTHLYTNDDANVAEPVRRFCLHQYERFAKPHIFGEFGIRSHASTADKDPEGWAIHNALWAGLFSFAAGGPMPWWHENYLDELNLYFHFTALARFTAGLPLGAARWEPLATSPPEYVDKTRPPEVRDAIVSPSGGWEKAEHNEFVVQADGTIQDGRLPQQLLHGAGHRDLKSPTTFVVDYPQPGRFIVRVGKVSASGLLRVAIDGQQRLERELPCGKGLGKESVYRPQWKIWETTYDQDIAVDVPAGKHQIRVENSGKDWVAVSAYVLTGCRVLDKPNVLVCGMKTDRLAMLWLQNHESCWYNHAAGKVAEVRAFALTASGLGDGKYRLQWWETWKGTPGPAEDVEVRQGRLTIAVPALKTDVALTIQPR
jgi:hypothetical protein